eukprot:jgi/Bigna1/144558/aug1.88_g19266
MEDFRHSRLGSGASFPDKSGLFFKRNHQKKTTPKRNPKQPRAAKPVQTMGSAASKGNSLPPRAQPSSRQAKKTEERKMALTSCYHTKKAGEKLVDLFYDSLKPEYSALPAPADITHTIRGMGHSRSYARLVEFLENGFSGLPAEVDPSTWMPQKRKLRKQHQVASMIRRIFVDFCGGAGHVGLLVAYLFPNWKVICVDLKKKSLELGAQRAEKLGILNYSTACIDVRKFEGHDCTFGALL